MITKGLAQSFPAFLGPYPPRPLNALLKPVIKSRVHSARVEERENICVSRLTQS